MIETGQKYSFENEESIGSKTEIRAIYSAFDLYGNPIAQIEIMLIANKIDEKKNIYGIKPEIIKNNLPFEENINAQVTKIVVEEPNHGVLDLRTIKIEACSKPIMIKCITDFIPKMFNQVGSMEFGFRNHFPHPSFAYPPAPQQYNCFGDPYSRLIDPNFAQYNSMNRPYYDYNHSNGFIPYNNQSMNGHMMPKPGFYGMSNNEIYKEFESSTSYGTGIFQPGSDSQSIRSSIAPSKQEKKRNSQFKDFSTISNSTDSIMSTSDGCTAKMAIKEMTVDFSCISNPKIELKKISNYFYITKLDNSLISAGLKWFDVIIKIDDQEMELFSSDDGEAYVKKLFSSKQILNLDIGRIQSRSFINDLKRKMEAKPLDSISTIASTTTISSSDKENIDNVASSSDFKESNQQPDCKTSIGDSIDGFSDCTFDDIRHNLTMDTSLLNIARVMKHPDSKLASATRSYCNMKLPRSFTGISIIEWLLAYVKGLHTGKEARALAQRLVNSRYIRCPLAGKQNSVGFSENSLYVFSNQLNELTDILNDIIEEDEEDLQESTANSKDRNGNRNSYSLDNQSEPNSISSKQKINGSLNNSRNSSSIIMKKPPKVARQSSIRKSGKFASVV